MKKNVLKNKEIYRIGDKVLNSVRLPDEAIDKIIAAPHLFERVRAGIESAQVNPAVNTGLPRYTFRLQNAWAVVAVVVIVTGAFGLFSFARQNYIGSNLAGMVPPAEIPQITSDVPEIDVIEDRAEKVRARSERNIAGTVKTRSQVKPLNRAKEIEMGEFHALTYAGERDEPGEGGRIVRVKLSPASLFAMGVDVPLENETDRITADLLIGADGVMKSVRLEKKN